MERVKDVVREKGFSVDSGAIPFGVGTPDRREVHRVVKLEDADILMLDLMVVSPSLEPVWDSRNIVEWQGRDLPIVSRWGLIQMKKTAGRPKDMLDIEELEKLLESEDE